MEAGSIKARLRLFFKALLRLHSGSIKPRKGVQVVKWRQETVRCEEARGALEAEVVDTRTQLLEQQQCRARSIKALLRL